MVGKGSRAGTLPVLVRAPLWSNLGAVLNTVGPSSTLIWPDFPRSAPPGVSLDTALVVPLDLKDGGSISIPLIFAILPCQQVTG